MTITNLTYNCNPESLGDMTLSAFVDAFENEIVTMPLFRECRVCVTMLPHPSELVEISGVDLPDDAVSHFDKTILEAAERAFAHCCEEC